jgi:hypothetical protein
MTDPDFQRETRERLDAIEDRLREVAELLKLYDKGQAEMLLILKDLTSEVVKLGGNPPDYHRGNGRQRACRLHAGRDLPLCGRPG